MDPKAFEVRDMVLQENVSNTTTKDELKGKFEPNWFGPYIITKVFDKGAYILSTLDGEVLKNPINSRHLKKYHIYVTCGSPYASISVKILLHE